jgi:hypothetical protein
LVPIQIGLSAPSAQLLRLAFRPVPPPVEARALLDTGAEMTCVDSALIQLVGPSFGGTVMANLPAHGGITIVPRYDVTLTIVHPSGDPDQHLVLHNITVLEIPLAVLGYQAVIGRDVLAQCRFLYDGPGNHFELAY